MKPIEIENNLEQIIGTMKNTIPIANLKPKFLLNSVEETPLSGK